MLLSGVPCSATLVEWDFTGAGGAESSWAATSADPALTGTAFTRTGLNGNAGANSFNSTAWAIGDYVSFGFEVDSGYTVDLTNLLITTRASNTGPGTLGLYYSGDGFTSPLTTISQSGASDSNSTVDLSALTGLTGTIEFRLAQIGTISANGGTVASGGTLRVQNFSIGPVPVQFNGTVAAIPEPTAALFGSLLAGAFGLMVARRPAGRD